MTAQSPEDLPADASRTEIESDIEATRDRLVDSIDELAAKLDVKARVTDSVRRTKADAQASVVAAGDKLGSGTNEAIRTVQRTSPMVRIAVAALPIGLAVMVVITVVRSRTRRGRAGRTSRGVRMPR